MKGRIFIIFMLLIGAAAMYSCGNKSAVESEDKANLLALYNCTVINGSDGEPVNNGVILMRGDMIEKIGESSSLSIPEDFKKIDLNGKTVLPGFINAHVHLAYNETNLKNWLMGGVTTVRDMDPGPSIDFTSFRDENNKRSDTSRIVSSSPMLTVKNGYGSVYFSSTEEAVGLVNSYIDKNADLVKISLEEYLRGIKWSMPKSDQSKAIVEAAHARGVLVSVHITDEKFLKQAVELGVDDLAHMVVNNTDDETIEAIINKDIYWEPTLELWHGVGGNYIKTAISNLSRFYKAGGKIALGTDFAGYTCKFDTGFPITEVKLMSEAGMSNMDIIKAGTINAAHVCGMEEEFGSLEVGKIADILVVEGNPLDNIEDLQNTYMVIHNGQVVFTKVD